MPTDVFDILDGKLPRIADNVRRDVAARLAAGVPITSMRNGVVVVERMRSGELVVEPASDLKLPDEDRGEPIPPRRAVSG